MDTKNSISFFNFSKVLNFGKVAILLSFLFQSSSLYAQCVPTHYRLDSFQISTWVSGINGPHGITADAIGNTYVTTNSGAISKITPSGIVNTFASGLGNVVDIVSDANGNVYATIVDSGTVKKITPSGIVSTFASGLQCPTGITIDCSGNLYVTKTTHYCSPGTATYSDNVYKILPSGSVITLGAAFLEPIGITTDGSGNVYVLSRGNTYISGQPINGSISKITPSGTVSTLVSGLAGLSSIYDMTADFSGNLYLTRPDDGSIVKISAGGILSNVTVGFNAPYGITTDLSGNLYVASSGDNKVSKIITGAIIALGSYTVGSYTHTTSGFYTDTLTAASVSGCDSIVTLNLTIVNSDTFYIAQCTAYTWSQTGITYTQSGIYSNPYDRCNTGFLNLTIKPSGRDTVSVTECNSYTWIQTGVTYTQSGFYYKTYTAGAANGCDSIITLNLTINSSRGDTVSVIGCGSYMWEQTGVTYTQQGFYDKTYTNMYGCDSTITLHLTIKKLAHSTLGTAQIRTFVTDSSAPYGIVADANGNLYVTHSTNGTVSKITPSGVVSNFASGLPAPIGITIDSSGNLYVANINNNSISKITPDGTVSNFATGFAYPWGITIDKSNNLYVTNYGSSIVSKVTPAGTVSNFAWVSTYETGIAIDDNGNLYVTNYINSVINKITPAGTVSEYPQAGPYQPTGITTDDNGNLYVTSSAGTVSKIAPDGTVSTFASGFNIPYDITKDSNGNFYVTNTGTTTISKIVQGVTTCDSYTWAQNGQTYISSGTYTDTLAGAAANGCDSIITLNLTIKPISHSTVSVTACNSYTWTQTGITYTIGGNYIDTLTSVNGCDSIVTLNLTIKSISYSTVSITACNSYTWAQTGITYTTGGNYVDTLTANGCDSVVTLNLTIKPIGHSTISVTACNSYIWGQSGINYTQNGSYNDTLAGAAANGCDSIITLNLTIKPLGHSTINKAACGSYLWTQTGITYTTTGNYNDTLTGVATNGCDSIVTLNLTIRPNFRDTTETITQCNSYTWWRNGQTYTASGFYDTTYIGYAAYGCNSTLVLNLTITAISHDTISVTECNLYTWAQTGVTYTQSGFYNKIYTAAAANGCDSIVTLHLTIKSISRDTITPTACNNYFWAQTGITYTQNGFYSDTLAGAAMNGCDSIVTLNLIIQQPVHNILGNTGQVSTFATGFNFPIGITRDNSGNLYVTNSADNTIKKVTPTGTESTFATGLSTPYSITTNGNGNFYVTNYGNGTVSKIDAGGTISTLATGLTNPTGITMDGNGNLYIVRVYLGSINKITPDGTVSTFVTGLNYPFGITIDGSGNFYVTSVTGNSVSKITPNGTVSLFATGFNSPYSIAIDGSSNLYVGNYNDNSVSKVTPSGTVSTFATGFFRPEGIVLDGSGNFYITNYLTSTISKITMLVEACNSYTWAQNGQTYTSSGTYIDTLEGAAANGCDSIVTLPLSIKPFAYQTINQTQCGDSYTWTQNGQTYTSSGTYIDTLAGAAPNGCNKIVTLNLTIKPISRDTVSAVACNSYIWQGHNYFSTGTYIDTLPASNGCDSIVTLNLTIKPFGRDTISETACNSYFWASTGITYTQSGFYNHILAGAAANGCDSIITLKLTLQISRDIMHITANESYTWRGHTYTEGGLYSDTLTSVVRGCDSIKFLSLTINVPTTYEIPVVFHVVHTGQAIGTPQNPADSALENSIEFLNHVYAADGLIPGFPDTANGGVKIPIRFVLAKRTPDCQVTNGIDRIDGSGLSNYIANGVDVTGSGVGVPASTIYNLNTWDQSSYLNIWVVTGMSGGVVGFGTGDGVIITYFSIEDATIPHEVGHFFGLAHTFQGSTSTSCAPNDSCDRQGDGICDTEPHKETSASICPTGINECTGQPWGNVVYNIMNYSSCRNRFTAGQRDVIMVSLHGVGRLLSLPSNGGIPIVPVAEHDTVTSVSFGYRWHNSTYTTSGVYTVVEDCDTFILHFTFVPKPIDYDTVNIAACDNYTWTRNGRTYTQSNNYNDTVFTQDTVYLHTLHLTINHTLRTNLNLTSIWKIDTVATSSLFHNLVDITTDGNGNLYVVEISAGEVLKIDTGGNVSIYASNLSVPSGITIDGNGNLYVIEAYSGNVKKIDASGAVTTFATGMGYYSQGITIDPNGNLYVTNNANNNIRKITSSGVVSTFFQGVMRPVGITTDRNGNFYIASPDSGTITKIDTGGHTSIYAAGFDHPEHLTIDANGNMYVSSEYDNAVHKITPSGSVSTIAAFTTSYTGGIVSDGSGNLYVTTLGSRYYVYKLSQVIIDTLWVCGSLTVSNILHTQSGFYSDTLTSIATGCDSVVTVILGVKPIIRDTLSITACESYTWTQDGQIYTQSGLYSKTYTAANGCDSIKVLKLSVYQGTQQPIHTTAFQSYVWHSTAYTTSGTYTYSYNNDLGCPSTDTLYLTISATPVSAEGQCE